MYFSTAVILSLSAVALARPLPFQRRAAALDTGSCGSPEIEFANGLDGRKESAFEPVNEQDFNHGSADNIAIIANFVCGQLSTKCKASADTVTACNAGTQAAAQATGGAAADAFNAALGITTNFAAGAVDGTATAANGTAAGAVDGAAAASNGTAAAAASSAANSTADASTAANSTADASTAASAAACSAIAASNATAASDATATSNATAASDATAASNGTANAAASTGAAASAGNLQTFTGALGATPPAVTASGDGQFQVDGNASFKDLQNALVRDVQHNQCANAANASGNSGALTVSACGTQQDQCNAAAQSSAAAA